MSEPKYSIDITPTWEGLMGALVAVLQDGNQEGKRNAKLELQRLATVADTVIANQRTLAYAVAFLRSNVDDDTLEDLEATESDLEAQLTLLADFLQS